MLTGWWYDWYWSLPAILGAILGSVMVDVAVVGVPWSLIVFALDW